MNSNWLFCELKDEDLDMLSDFCKTCEKLGYHNNSSFKAIKLDQMKMPYGQYFIGIDLEKNIIFNLCGVHKLEEVNEHAYRVFFRGATLPGYAGRQFGFTSSIHFSIMLDMMIDFILKVDPEAEFYFTTNAYKSETNAKSQKMNDIFIPRIAKTGIFEKVTEDFYYMYTLQTLWKVNVLKYKNRTLR